jgi:hypothetical protein
MSKFARWSFTNFDLDHDYTQLMNECSYLIVGLETCPKTKTIHHQCYVEFTSQRVFSTIKKLVPKAHIESAKGGPEANKKYCSKDNNVIIEHGEMKRQGKRTDLDNVKKMIKNGATLDDIIDTDANYQCIRASEVILKYKEPKRNWKPNVYWYYGPTGTGKTKMAVEMAGARFWMSNKNLQWWEGYDGHENVIIDDFRPNYCDFPELLRILDRYEYRVMVKGGSRQLRCKNIWITAPFHPKDAYTHVNEDVNQLLRRIDEIKLFG